jgi:hypothetical protein
MKGQYWANIRADVKNALKSAVARRIEKNCALLK